MLYQQDNRSAVSHAYLYLGSRLVATVDYPFAGGSSVRYEHSDAQGSVIAETNASRAIIKTSVYASWGGLLNHGNDDAPGYTGHLEDSLTGLTYMQQRYYDPSVGRFLSMDPVGVNTTGGGNFNRYWYAKDNPYRYTDPFGLSTVTFDGEKHTITIYSKSGKKLGTYPAYNNVDSHHSIGKLVNGEHSFLDKNGPHMHYGASAKENGAYGPGGDFRVKPFKGPDGKTHTGIAIHAGRETKADRAGRSGPEHATNGCIRTNDAAIKAMTTVSKTDPLTTLTITNNRIPPPKTKQ